MAIATLGGLKSSPKAIPAPLTFVDRDLGEWHIRRHFATVCLVPTVRLVLLNRTPSSLVIFRGQRVLPGPVRTDSTFTLRMAVIGKRGATVLPDSGSTASLGRWG